MLDRLLPLLLFATGMTGLVYEVVLGRLLALHLGSSGASQAITLAAFLGGMAVGAVAIGRARTRLLAHMTRPLVAYALLEGFIGLWILAVVPLADATFPLLHAFGLGRDPGSGVMLTAKLLLATLLVAPLSMAMGATLPVLAAGVQRLDPRRGVQLVSRYYAVNAAGATIGAALAGFLLIDLLGMELPLTLGAALNLAIAIIVYRVASRQPVAPPVVVETPAELGTSRAGLGRLVVLAMVTGFVALLSEVLWTRLQVLLLGASVYAFAAMLCVVIAGITLGSALASRAIQRGRKATVVLGWTQWLAAAGTLLLCARLDALPIDLLGLRIRVSSIAENYGLWLGITQFYVALHLLPVAAALGAAFPALLAAAHDRGVANDRATAALLAANTAGNLMGALGGGFWLMPALGLNYGLMAAAALSLAMAALAWPLRELMSKRSMAFALVAAGLVALVVSPPTLGPLDWGLYRDPPKSLDAIEPRVRWNREAKTVFREDGKDATIAVENYRNKMLVFRVSGKADGSNGGDAGTQVLLGHVGYLFRPEARDVFIVGLGTGQTAAAVAAHPQTRVQVAELSPAIVHVAEIFAPYNGDVLKRSNVSVVVADARDALRTLPPQSLDLVVSEPSNPWVVGVADLYTVENFQRIRERLRPGGVLVQWMHSYEIGDRLLAAVVCTLRSVLPEVAVFRLGPGDLALVASDQPLQFEAAKVQAMLQSPGVLLELASHGKLPLPRSIDDWMVMQLAGTQTVAQVCSLDAPLLLERFPRLEYDAPRDFFAGRKPAKLLSVLDTRATSTPDVKMVAWLKAHPLDEARRAGLRAFLKDWGNEDELPLRAALSAGVGEGEAKGELPAEVLLALAGAPDPAGLTPAQRKEWCGVLRQKLPWLLDHPHTVLGPVVGKASVLAWAPVCGPGNP